MAASFRPTFSRRCGVGTEAARMWNLLPPSAPSAKQLPMALVQAAVFGLVVALPAGPLLAALNGIGFGPAHTATVGTASWLWGALRYGPAYAVTFYLLSALPAQLVQRRLVGVPLVLCLAMSAIVAVGGGLLGYAALAAMRGEAPATLISHVALVDG